MFLKRIISRFFPAPENFIEDVTLNNNGFFILDKKGVCLAISRKTGELFSRAGIVVPKNFVSLTLDYYTKIITLIYATKEGEKTHSIGKLSPSWGGYPPTSIIQEGLNFITRQVVETPFEEVSENVKDLLACCDQQRVFIKSVVMITCLGQAQRIPKGTQLYVYNGRVDLVFPEGLEPGFHDFTSFKDSSEAICGVIRT